MRGSPEPPSIFKILTSLTLWLQNKNMVDRIRIHKEIQKLTQKWLTWRSFLTLSRVIFSIALCVPQSSKIQTTSRESFSVEIAFAKNVSGIQSNRGHSQIQTLKRTRLLASWPALSVHKFTSSRWLGMASSSVMRSLWRSEMSTAWSITTPLSKGCTDLTTSCGLLARGKWWIPRSRFLKT